MKYLLIPLVVFCVVETVRVTKAKDAIPDRYIVTVDDTFMAFRLQFTNGRSSNPINGIEPLSFFDFGIVSSEKDEVSVSSSVLKGFVAEIKDLNVLETLSNQQGVLAIEEDQKVFATMIMESDATYVKQKNATWGLARVSKRKTLKHAVNNNYLHRKDGGKGVDVYVIDTGINIKHPDLEGRAVWDVTIPKFDEDTDGNGHGSHVAGTIAGKEYGIAKKATVHAVKVLRSDGSGSISDVLAGIEYVVTQHKKNKGQKTVINMSLGGGKSSVLDQAINVAFKSGIHAVVAAGNSNEDACDSSPSGSPYAIAVGASDINDELAYFSNYGKCVSIIAPGVNIKSIWNNGKGTKEISGTSMASPHVAGVVAMYLSEEDKNISPSDMKKMLIEASTKKVFDSLPSKTPNRLLYSFYNDDE